VHAILAQRHRAVVGVAAHHEAQPQREVGEAVIRLPAPREDAALARLHVAAPEHHCSRLADQVEGIGECEVAQLDPGRHAGDVGDRRRREDVRAHHAVRVDHLALAGGQDDARARVEPRGEPREATGQQPVVVVQEFHVIAARLAHALGEVALEAEALGLRT
jgi:hypothetical protein